LDNININVPVVTQKPTPAFTTTQRTVCTGTTVQFNDISQNAPRSWSWSFAGGTPATSTEQHPKITYNTPGTYQVTLTTSNSFGSATLTQQAYITVSGSLVPQVLANKTSVCSGDSVVLSASGAASYKWFEGTDFLGEGSSITVKPFKNASYRVAGKNASGCEGSNTIQINVKTAPAKPTISISAPSDSATVTLTSSAADTYQWLRNGTVIAGATNRTYNVTQAGSYSVRITSGECFNISNAAVLTASDYDQVAKQDLKLYPNPVADKLHIQLPPVSGNTTYKISIYNSLGVLVNELQTHAGNEELQLLVNNYSRGRYVILITNENIHYTQSFIKQ
jgi:PKD repeat protein